MTVRAMLLGVLLAGTAAAVSAQPDFSGTWERYPPPGEKADPRFAPTPIPNPPLKPQYKAQWEAKQKLLAERIEEGQPAGDTDRPRAAGALTPEPQAALRSRAGAVAQLAGDVGAPAVGHISRSHTTSL